MKRNRTLLVLWGGGLLAIVAAAGGLAGSWLTSARALDARSNIISAQEYRVVDRFGTLRGTLGVQPDGSIAFAAADQTGVVRSRFGVSSDGESFMQMLDQSDRTRVTMRVLPDGTVSMLVYDQNGVAIPFGPTQTTSSSPVQRTPPATSDNVNAPVQELQNCVVDLRMPDAVVLALLAKINEHRQAIGLSTVEFSEALARAALWKAESVMSVMRPLTLDDHDDGFRTWDQRILDCGYPPSANFGEMLGDSFTESTDPLQSWQGSAVHSAILVNPVWRYIGIARVYAGMWEGQPLYHWVVTFGDQP